MTSAKSTKHPATIITNFNGEQAPFTVYPQEWDGNLMRFYFDDERYQNSGLICFQADTGQIQIQSDKPYTQFKTSSELNSYLLDIARLFVKFYHFGWSPPEKEMPSYDENYYSTSGYLKPGEHECEVKAFQAALIRDLVHPQKTLVAGCVSGELVRQLKLLGIDAFGFDILPDLKKHVLPEVKDFCEPGSVQKIPFAKEDGFETCLLIDVLEHIPERDIPLVVQEWLRLGFKKIVTLINFNQFNFAGHITLRPPIWWQNQWADTQVGPYKLIQTYRLEKETLYANDNDYNHQWMVFENSP